MTDRNGVRRLGRQYSSYHGKIHCPKLAKPQEPFQELKVIMDSVTTGRVVYEDNIGTGGQKDTVTDDSRE